MNQSEGTLRETLGALIRSCAPFISGKTTLDIKHILTRREQKYEPYYDANEQHKPRNVCTLAS